MNSTSKLTPFETHHVREANTVLRKLTKRTEGQQLDQQDETTVRKMDNVESQPEPSGQLYQRAGDRNLHRYSKTNSKLKSKSTHTLALENGVVLRKSANAVSKNASNKKKTPTGSPQPHKPRDLKRKQRKRTITKDPKTMTLKQKGLTT